MKNDDLDPLLELGGAWAAQAYFDRLSSDLFHRPSDLLEKITKIQERGSGVGLTKILESFREILHMDFSIHSPVDLKTNLKLPNYLKIAKEIEDWMTPEFWLDELQTFMNCNKRALLDNIKKVWWTDHNTKHQMREIIIKFTGPWICDLYRWDKDFAEKVSFLLCPHVELIRKKWGIIRNRVSILVSRIPQNAPKHYSYVYRAIHDATHVLHLAQVGSACNVEQINWQICLEALAMNTEYTLLQILKENESPFAWDLDKDEWRLVHLTLLLGMFERATRIAFDKRVHEDRISPQEWKKEIIAKTGLNLPIYGFAESMHGMPGLPSAYLIALKKFRENPSDQLAIIQGKKNLELW